MNNHVANGQCCAPSGAARQFIYCILFALSGCAGNIRGSGDASMLRICESGYQEPPVEQYSPVQSSLSGKALDDYVRISNLLKLDDDALFHLIVRNPEVVKELKAPSMLMFAFEKPTAGLLAGWKKQWNPEPYCFESGCGSTGKVELIFSDLRGLHNLRRNFDDRNHFMLTHISKISRVADEAKACFAFNVYHNDALCPNVPSGIYDNADAMIRAGVDAIAQSKTVLRAEASNLLTRQSNMC